MKGFLGCCYQCDVPPETIQNLRICLSDKSVVFAHGFIYLLNVQLQLEKIFCFFLGWARPDNRLVSSGWARPVRSSLQAVKQFIFIFILYLGLDGIYIQLDQLSRRRRYCTGNLALTGP